MAVIAADEVFPDPQAALRRFDAAAPRFAEAAFIHAEARNRLLGRLDYLRHEPRVVVDLGSGPGAGARALSERFPAARVIAIDSSAAMLAAGRAAAADLTAIRADAGRLPLRQGSVDLLFANLLLPWGRPDVLLSEMARVLAKGGLLLVSTVGPATLGELRAAWRGIAGGVHVHGFLDMHDLGDLIGRSGFAEPVMDADRLSVTYASAAALWDDLTASAARNSARGRMRGLTGRDRWRRFEAAVNAGRTGDRLPVSVELIFAQAWGAGPRPEPGAVEVPVSQIGRR